MTPLKYLLHLLLIVLPQVLTAEIDSSTFSCEGRPGGYYADVASDCEQYHVCAGGKLQYTYSCPNETRFQQRMMICDHWYLVDCNLSERDFGANLLIGRRDVPFVGPDEFKSQGKLKESPKNYRSAQPFSTTVQFKNPTTRNYQPFKFTTPNYQTTQPIFQKANRNSSHTATSQYPQFTTKFPFSANGAKSHYQFPSEQLEQSATFSPNNRNNNFNPGKLQFSTITPFKTFPSFPAITQRAVKTTAKTASELSDVESNSSPNEDLSTPNISSSRLPKAEEDFDLRQQNSNIKKLEWTLPDTRAMMYIPDDPSDIVAPNIKRFSVTIPKAQMMFKNTNDATAEGACPEHCHPGLMNPETCTPCINIK